MTYTTDKETRIRLAGELLVADSKLSAVREWYNKTKFKRGQLSDDAWIAPYKILEGLDDSVMVIPIRQCSEFTTKDDNDE